MQESSSSSRRSEVGRPAAIDQWLRAQHDPLTAGAMFDAVDVALVHVIVGRVALANAAFARCLGQSADELVGQELKHLLGPEVVPLLADFAEGESEPSRSARHRLDLQSPDGVVRRCEVAVRCLCPGRAELGVLLTFHDISDLLEQSDRLRHSVHQLETLIDTEPVGIAHLEHGCIVRVNPAMCRLLDRPREELEGRKFHDFCMAPWAGDLVGFFDPASRGASALALAGERVFRAALRRPYDVRLDCLLHLAPIGASAAGARLVVAVDLRRHQAALSLAAQMQVRFDAYATLLDDAIIVVDARERCVVHANPASASVLGVTPQSLIGRAPEAIWLCIPDGSRARVDEAWSALERGRNSEAVVAVRLVTGAESTVRLRFINGGGVSGEYFIVADDITRQVQSENERLRDAIAQRDALVREVHHRIKNNLQGVAGLLEHTSNRLPALREVLADVARQIHAVAQVHGLQMGLGGILAPEQIVVAVAANLKHAFGCPPAVELSDETGLPAWRIPEREAVPLALVINELLTNAYVHRVGSEAPRVRILPAPHGLRVRIANHGYLDADFSLADRTASHKGLGLVKALLPRRGGSLSLCQEGDEVVAWLDLGAPTLRRADHPSIRHASPEAASHGVSS